MNETIGVARLEGSLSAAPESPPSMSTRIRQRLLGSWDGTTAARNLQTSTVQRKPQPSGS
jgi:hypothetical protein